MTQYEFMCKMRDNDYSCRFTRICDICPLHNNGKSCGGSDALHTEHKKRISLVDNWIKQYEEEHMDKRQKALERIKKAEAEIAEAKKILEEQDPRIGKLCVVCDGEKDKAHITCIVVKEIDNTGELYNIIDTRGDRWRNARLLTKEEKEKYL